MAGNFGTPEDNNYITVQQAYARAISNGYMSQLQAYGVGRGLSMQEAEQRALDQLGTNIHPQMIDTYNNIKKNIDSARKSIEREEYLDSSNAVSTGANKVKTHLHTNYCKNSKM